MKKIQSRTEPEKMDKDVVRDYIKKNCDDPYKSILPTVPVEHINRVIVTLNCIICLEVTR